MTDKTLRRARHRAHGKSALHLVGAWVAELRLVLGRLKTADRSDEITAVEDSGREISHSAPDGPE
jgi:hypothetical protein